MLWTNILLVPHVRYKYVTVMGANLPLFFDNNRVVFLNKKNKKLKIYSFIDDGQILYNFINI
jgi:hypothetical protein